MNKSKNPPAFPCKVPLHPVDCGSTKMVMGDMPGMTLRDYFAAAALNGLLAGHPEQVHSCRQTVELAYRHADEMLGIRESY